MSRNAVPQQRKTAFHYIARCVTEDMSDCTEAVKLDPTNTIDLVAVQKAAADAEHAASAASRDLLAEVEGEGLPSHSGGKGNKRRTNKSKKTRSLCGLARRVSLGAVGAIMLIWILMSCS